MLMAEARSEGTRGTITDGALEGVGEEGGGRWEVEEEGWPVRRLLKRVRLGPWMGREESGAWVALGRLRVSAGVGKERDVAGRVAGMERGTRGFFLRKYSLRMVLRRVVVGVGEPGAGD